MQIVLNNHSDLGSSGTSKTIDWNTAIHQSLTLTGNCTLTFSNGVSGGVYHLSLLQDGTGSRTVTWPGAVKWPAASGTPTLTTTAGKSDEFMFVCDGTNYFARVRLNY